MKMTRDIVASWRGLRFSAALGALVLLTALPAFSQGCALCYTQAAAAGARMIAALRSGIIILVVPPTLASVGMCFVVHHKRNQVRRDASSDGSSKDW
jgi:hypothetical protein